jgi:hypothetical protein
MGSFGWNLVFNILTFFSLYFIKNNLNMGSDLGKSRLENFLAKI